MSIVVVYMYIIGNKGFIMHTVIVVVAISWDLWNCRGKQGIRILSVWYNHTVGYARQWIKNHIVVLVGKECISWNEGDRGCTIRLAERGEGTEKGSALKK